MSWPLTKLLEKYLLHSAADMMLIRWHHLSNKLNSFT